MLNKDLVMKVLYEKTGGKICKSSFDICIYILENTWLFVPIEVLSDSLPCNISKESLNKEVIKLVEFGILEEHIEQDMKYKVNEFYLI